MPDGTGRILVPLSLTPLTPAKLRVAEQHARAFHAAVYLLHVLPTAALDPDGVSSVEATARAYLDQSVAQLRAGGIDSEGLVRFGAPAPTIVDEVRARQAGLIIIGSNLGARLPRVLLGSVADGVIREAPCPVLLVRPPPEIQPSPPLLTLDPPEQLAPRSLGRRTVDLARIVGSATRAHELGSNFRSLHSTTADEQRFQGILASFARGDDVPSIELYKLGFGYYVRDGHHRVAAARQLGRKEIEADVTDLVRLDDEEAQRTFDARLAFEQATGLTRIGASRAESYSTLKKLIEDYRVEHGIDDVREAAERWYAEVFRPLRRQIRLSGLARHAPGERAADVIARDAACHRKERGFTTKTPSTGETTSEECV